eukprot:8357169-Alexandrium_andersonii.AAC.1
MQQWHRGTMAQWQVAKWQMQLWHSDQWHSDTVAQWQVVRDKWAKPHQKRREAEASIARCKILICEDETDLTSNSEHNNGKTNCKPQSISRIHVGASCSWLQELLPW